MRKFYTITEILKKNAHELNRCVVVVPASSVSGKVSLMAMATKEAVSKGAHAGNLIKEIAALVGGGGGRPNMAQAGGKNPDGIDAAIAKVKEALEKQL